MDGRRLILALFVALCAGTLLGVAGTVLGGRALPAPIVIEPPPPTATPAAPAPWRVHVTGAVKAPGVYELAPGAIAQEAILAAGGFAADAAQASVNLARPLADGVQMSVPTTEESSSGATGAGPPLVPASAHGKLNLNTATLEALQTLPGIGPSTAANIITYRETNGPFASIEAIMDVPGIGPAKFEQIAALVTVAP
jgi:competence protein ComEA